MNPLLADIKAFHEKYGLAYDGNPQMLTTTMHKFRTAFMQEELDEYCSANDQYLKDKFQLPTIPPPSQAQCLADLFDGLIDIVYVALGTAYLHGFDFESGWALVHEANMEKVRAESPSSSQRHSAFDVVKPEGWKAPNLLPLVVPSYRAPDLSSFPDQLAAECIDKGKEVPHIICLCGSTSFRTAFEEANLQLTLAGHIVLTVGGFGHSGHTITDDQKVELDELHLEKIDMADAILVLDVGGYIGESTRREMAYALYMNKPIFMMQQKTDAYLAQNTHSLGKVLAENLKGWHDR